MHLLQNIENNLPIDDSNTKTAIIGSLMVNSVCLNNVPSLVLLKVFAKFNTLKENTKHHKMLSVQ